MAQYSDNRKAYFEYEPLEKYEAGIELLGHEVKAVRSGRASLPGSHVIVRGGEAYVINMDIPPYQPKNTSPDYDAKRTRRLLLTKKEIGDLSKKGEMKGLTIIPVSLYSKGRKIKMEIAVMRGKKIHDKRETIKKRDTDRELRREMK